MQSSCRLTHIRGPQARSERTLGQRSGSLACHIRRSLVGAPVDSCNVIGCMGSGRNPVVAHLVDRGFDRARLGFGQSWNAGD